MRVIALLTDFGWRDAYVGVMKGVIASIAPRAQVIDVCHEVEPFQIGQARFLLAQSWPYFPKGTIHVCVVDPGVGGARRPLLIEAAGHLFAGPDNGLFSDILAIKGARAREITNPKLMLKSVSRTFHGRDIFAPVAAQLAAGKLPARVGKVVKDATRLETGVPFQTGKRFWSGEVAHVDRFGNVITNLTESQFPDLAARGFVLRVGLRELRRLAPNYESIPEGGLAVLVGSSGHYEVALNQGSAVKALGVEIGAPVELEVR